MRSWIKEDALRQDIIYEDQEVLVCRKHAGIAVQNARVGQMDLESILRNYLQGGYLGIVQRLDQPVEGILVFGKTPKAAAALNRQQQAHKMKKWYLAAFVGKAKEQKGYLTDYLVKDGKTNLSRVVNEQIPGAKQAALSYKIVKPMEGDNPGVAEIQLETGRHHQIRAQMAYHGMPLWADRKYRSVLSVAEESEALALCAYRLEFLHPKTNKKLSFQIEPDHKRLRN